MCLRLPASHPLLTEGISYWWLKSVDHQEKNPHTHKWTFFFVVCYCSFSFICKFYHPFFCLLARTDLYQLKPICFLTSHMLAQKYLESHRTTEKWEQHTLCILSLLLERLGIKSFKASDLIYLLSREEMGNWINMRANHAGRPNIDIKGKIQATCILWYMGLWMIGGFLPWVTKKNKPTSQ